MWMKDYMSDEGPLEEQVEANLPLFTPTYPLYFEEVVKCEKWRTVMDSKMKAIKRNDTWKLTELPISAKKIRVKWVYKTKLKENGEVHKHKARLVAKIYVQQ
uniref:Reverse transcriptase Ty1/copia-type domain-containing protein n=1 Tax=Cajanus cajan TaxID=3821 RepID=A0A151RIU6_CAJCA|nr:hypothetical protein KK1_036121 [Cajanus cajan]